MKVLVTGSTGRFGPYLVRELVNAGHEVVLFSRRKPADEFKDLKWVQGDITVYEDCLKALEGGFDAIQHAAAQPGPTDHPEMTEYVKKRGLSFDDTMRSNIMGLYYLLHAALEKDVGIFVMTGSNCALGHGSRISDRPFPFKYFPIDEEHPSDVEDSYSYSKLAGEMLLSMYTRAYGMRTYALRSAGIFNEERRRNTAKNVKPATQWDTWLWAWVGSEDLASAHRLLMEKANEIEPHGVYFCNGDDTTALEPTRELIEKFMPDMAPHIRDLEGHASLISNKKLKEAVGWQPKTSWRMYLE